MLCLRYLLDVLEEMLKRQLEFSGERSLLFGADWLKNIKLEIVDDTESHEFSGDHEGREYRERREQGTELWLTTKFTDYSVLDRGSL